MSIMIEKSWIRGVYCVGTIFHLNTYTCPKCCSVRALFQSDQLKPQGVTSGAWLPRFLLILTCKPKNHSESLTHTSPRNQLNKMPNQNKALKNNTYGPSSSSAINKKRT